jgi:hypothetical protein
MVESITQLSYLSTEAHLDVEYLSNLRNMGTLA